MTTTTVAPPLLSQDVVPFAVGGGSGLIGCSYCWCLDQPKMTLTQFIIGMAISMVGYPFCTALIASIFSKSLGKRPQVTMKHLFSYYPGFA